MCLLLNSILITIKRMTSDIYLLYLDLLVQTAHIHRSEWPRNKVKIIVSVRKTVCVMVPSVLWNYYDVHPNNIWSGYLSDLAAENDNMWAQRQERTFEISGQKWR